MFNAFKIFRIFGILPFKLVKIRDPVLCPKWHFYSCIAASLVAILAFCRALIYLQYPLDTKNPNIIFIFLLKCSPMFNFVHICVMYYTMVNRKTVKRAVEIVKLLMEVKLKSRKVGSVVAPEKMIVYYAFGTLIILSLLICGLCYLMIQYVPTFALMSVVDYWVTFVFSVILTIQVLQFCVYFEVIVGAFSQLDAHQPIASLIAILKLRDLKNKIEHLYYPNIICLELNCLIFCISGFRAAFDFMSKTLITAVIGLIIVIWITCDVPLQFYLMHLSQIIDGKVSPNFFGVNFQFSIVFFAVEYKMANFTY